MTAKTCPTFAAMFVALTPGNLNANKALNTLPPSIGKVGIRLKTTNMILAIKI